MNVFRNLFAMLLLAVLFAGSAWATEKVNVNTADAATLARVLDNIGEAKAEAIVEYRKANGPFRSVEQLAQVKGVGLKTVEKNRDRIVFGARPAQQGAARAAPPANRQAARQR